MNNTELQRLVFDAMEKFGRAAKLSKDFVQSQEAEKQAAMQYVSRPLQQCEQLKLINADEKATLQSKLAEHKSALVILSRVLDELTETRAKLAQYAASNAGEVTSPQKTAAAGALAGMTKVSGRVLGSRVGAGQYTEADEKLWQALGVI